MPSAQVLFSALLAIGGAVAAAGQSAIARNELTGSAPVQLPPTAAASESATGLSPSEAPPSSLVVTSAVDDAGSATNCTPQSSTTTGTDASCSLRDALLEAAKLGGGDIYFDSTAFASATTIVLKNGSLAIPSKTTIQGRTAGSGASLTNLVTVSGNHAVAVFTVNSGESATAVANLIIADGESQGGGGISSGGGLAVSDCTFIDNKILTGGLGGAIENGGTLAVGNSSFISNGLVSGGSGGYGGAIYSYGNADIQYSTFYGNSACQGAAINNLGVLKIEHSTLSGNSTSCGSAGGAILNGGTSTVSSSVLAGDEPGECAGIGCAPGPAYIRVGGSENGKQTGEITIALTDSLGNNYSETAGFGEFSTPASIAATFGPAFSGDLPNLSAEAFGSLIEFELYNGAKFGTFTITNPSSFTLTQVTEPMFLSGHGNVVGAAGNLSLPGSYGGPTETLIPLPNSPAICASAPTLIPAGVTLDQRGAPNTNTAYPEYSTTPCVDSGSVQTSYALAFSTEPPASTVLMKPFEAAVDLDESGKPFAPSVAIPLALSGNGTLSNGSASTEDGIATYPDLAVSGGGNGDTLTATLTLNANAKPPASISAVSSPFTVLPGIPPLTWNPPAAITFGTRLGATQLDATSTVAGTFTYSPPAGATPKVGTHTLWVTFTPTDTVDYKAVMLSTTLAVNPATPALTWTTPAAIHYGKALSSTQLDAKANVPGTFRYSPAAGTILTAGTQTLSVVFTPTDTTDYTTATGTVTLTVDAAAVPLSWPTPAPITYPAKLSSTQLDATSGGVAGTFTYLPAAGVVLKAGTYNLWATFTPTDTTDYKVSEIDTKLTVNP